MGLFAEFNGFGMSTPSAPGSTIVAAREWRQHVAVDVSPQNRVALRIKATKWRQERSLSPLRGFRNLGGYFLWTYVHSYTLSPLSWLACRTQGKRSQQSEAYRNHPTTAKLIPVARPSQRCGTVRSPPLNSVKSPRREGDFNRTACPFLLSTVQQWRHPPACPELL